MALSRRLGMAALVVALGAWLAASARAVDPKYLPGDTEIIISINFKQMRESEIAKQYKEILEQARGALEGQLQTIPAAKYLEKAGFDPINDVHAITVASNGSKEVENGFLVIEGKFNLEKINAALQELERESGDVLKISKIGATKVYELTPPQGNLKIYAAFVNNSTLVVCPTEAGLKGALSGNNNRGMKETIKALLKTTSSKQSISFLATGNALSKLTENAPIPNGEVVAGALQNLDGISIAITLAKDIQFQLGINAKDEETAKDLAQKANVALLFVKTLATQKAKENEELQPLVEITKTLRVSNDGANMVLRADVSVENLEKLIKVLPKNFNR
ncbi:MAG: hypothetical protein NZO58_11485 [Gemmataceae bacterium]|nr:hypothetical protein [Gemmataceae bacterium]